MTPAEWCDFELKHLNLVLSFFQRADSRLSLVLGIDIGMLAVLGSNAPPARSFAAGTIALTALPVLAIGWSMMEVYRGLFPNLDGGDQSLVYFRTISERTEAKFMEQLQSASHEELARDLIGQVWRNSQILRMKFDRLKFAFQLMAVAVPLWVVALLTLIAQDHSATHLLSH